MESRHNKIALVGSALLALGAGSYFALFRGASTASPQQQTPQLASRTERGAAPVERPRTDRRIGGQDSLVRPTTPTERRPPEEPVSNVTSVRRPDDRIIREKKHKAAS